jgi:hypothetical protein
MARGLYLPLFPRRECLEPMDRAGGFMPIGFLQTNFTPETTWLRPDPDLMVWREERQFHGWDTHGWYLRDEHHIVVSERYSPWQLLYLADALAEWNATVSLRQVSEYGNDVPEILARQQAASAARLRALAVVSAAARRGAGTSRPTRLPAGLGSRRVEDVAACSSPP